MSKENFQKELRLLAEDMVKQYAYTKELDAMVRPLDNPMNRRDFTKIEKDAWEDFGDQIHKIYEKYKNETFFRDEQPLKNSYSESVWLYAKTYCEDLPESYWVNRETKEKISNSDMWKGLEIDEQPDPDLFKKVVRPDITSAIEAQETIIQELCESGHFEDLSSKFNEIKDSANLMQQKTTLAYGTSEDFRKWASEVRAEERKPTKEEYDIVSTEALAMSEISEGTVDPKLELEAPEKEELENTVETIDTPVVISEDVQEDMIPRSRQDRPKQPEQTDSYFRNEDTSLLQGIDPDASEENDLIDDFEDIEVGVKDSEDSSFVKNAVETKENPKKIDSAPKEDSLDRSDLQVATETIPVEDNPTETLVKESDKQIKKENVIEKPEDQTVKRDNPSQDSVRDILEVDGIKEPSKEGVVNPQAENKIKEQDPAVKTFNKEAIKNQVKTGKEDSVEFASRGGVGTVSMSEALGLSAPLVTDKKETSVVKDDDHIPHGMGLNEVGAGGALNDGSKKVLNATEEAAKQASESSKAVQKTAKNVSIKDRLKDVATNKDWTDITAEAKKAQDNAWRPVDAIESVSSQFALGIKNGVGNDNELRSEANQSEFRKNEEELEEAEKFSETGSEKFSEEGKGIGRKVINTPGDTASKAGEAWNKKKQVEEKLKKFKKKKAERLKAKEATQKQAVDAQNTAKMARKAQTTSQAATGTAEAPGAVAQAGAMNSAQISQELGRNAVIQSSAQAADTAQKATQVAAETAKNAAETSANTAATASTTAAEAGSGPIGWILLIVEAAIIVFIASTLAILAICFIVALFSSEDEDGYATSEQRIELQKHMLRVAQVYHEKGKGVKNYDAYWDDIMACVEFDPKELDYNNISYAAKTSIGDDTYEVYSYFHPNNYVVNDGNLNIDGHWCAAFASYLYSNGAYDHSLKTAVLTDQAVWYYWNSQQNMVAADLVTSSQGTGAMTQGFISRGHAIAVGTMAPEARYIPTVGDAVFLENDQTYDDAYYYTTDWHMCPSHVEIVVAVDYNAGYFYTINGNNGSDEGMGFRRRSFKNKYGVYDTICAFGRVCSRPDEYYAAEASM